MNAGLAPPSLLEYYVLREVSQPLIVSYCNNITHSTVIFCYDNLLVIITIHVCIAWRSSQELISVTYPVTNTSDRTPHTEVAITQPGVIQHTVYVEKSHHYASDIKLIADDREVKVLHDLSVIGTSGRFNSAALVATS